MECNLPVPKGWLGEGLLPSLQRLALVTTQVGSGARCLRLLSQPTRLTRRLDRLARPYLKLRLLSHGVRATMARHRDFISETFASSPRPSGESFFVSFSQVNSSGPSSRYPAPSPGWNARLNPGSEIHPSGPSLVPAVTVGRIHDDT